jgi:transcriptional regulator with XRE-family HTH domain
MSKLIRKTPSRALVVLRDNLKGLAEKNEWTQARLGEKTGIGQRQAGRILNLEVEPTLATLSNIADHLRVQEPLLLCPDMKTDHLAVKPGIRKELRALIDDLIRLDNEGKLSDQTLAFLSSSLAIAVPGKPAPARPKKAAQ